MRVTSGSGSTPRPAETPHVATAMRGRALRLDHLPPLPSMTGRRVCCCAAPAGGNAAAGCRGYKNARARISNSRQHPGHGRVIGISRSFLLPEHLVVAILWTFSGLAGIAGQPHIKSLFHQYLISEAIIQRRPDTLLPDADLRWLALQQINRHMSNHSHIMRCIASTNPTLVFTERPGGRGRLPARGSHRSGRARFEHPAPRTMDSLRNGTHCAPRTLEGGDRSCATRRIAPTSSARATNAGPATCAIASRLRIASVATPWRCR